MTRAIIVKRDGGYIVAAEGAAVVGSLTAQAKAARDAAAASAVAAEAAGGPTYANTTAGLAATTDGEGFAVNNGDGTVTVYLNDSGSAVEQRTLATTAALYDPDVGPLLIRVKHPLAVTSPAILTMEDALNNSVPNVDHWAGPDTDRLTNMVADLGYFTLRGRTHTLEDTILVPAGGPYGTRWSGAGSEVSTINCVGMDGLPAIKSESASSLYRISMNDFGIIGDCATCIDFSDVSGAYQLYSSTFRNLLLVSDTDSTFKASGNFSVLWDNVRAFSNDGHCFDIRGDVARTFMNCYAHKCGATKAGYRIAGNANLIACNGVDEGGYFGDFGAVTSQDGENLQFRIKMIGGNMEDFSVAALRLRYTGSLLMEQVGFLPSSAVAVLIDHSEYGAAGMTLVDRGCYYAPKAGGSVTNSWRLQTNSAPAFIESTGVFQTYRRTDQSVTYTVPQITSANPGFGVLAHSFDRITYARSYGFNLQVPTLWTPDALTFDVTRINAVRTANTVATSIRTASGGEKGQRLTIIVEDANTTIQHNYASAGRFLTASGSNITATNGGVYEFVLNGANNWVQV